MTRIWFLKCFCVVTAMFYGHCWTKITVGAKTNSLFAASQQTENAEVDAIGAPFDDDCPNLQEIGRSVKPIGDISLHNLRPEGDPPNPCFRDLHPEAQDITAPSRRAEFDHSFCWKASGLIHQPLYFEDVDLERYGHTRRVQPGVSGIRFLGNLSLLPVKMVLNHPRECIYTLGHARPGNCTCPVKERPLAGWKKHSN